MNSIFKNIIPYIVFQKTNNENVLVVLNKNIHFSLFVLKSHINYQYNLLSCISGALIC
jgi:branched-subunit amino acid transport protein AzlD